MMTSDNIINASEADFEYEVLAYSQQMPVLVDFWAPWCGPCRMVAPTIDKLAEDYKGRAVIGKINVDEESELAEQFKVMSIPTIYILKNGIGIIRCFITKNSLKMDARVTCCPADLQ